MGKFFISIREKLYTVLKYVQKPWKLICDINNYDNYRFAHLIPDKLYLKCLFRKYMGQKLNLSSPVTFNEKLQWLKLHDRKPEYATMADKAEVKKYIAEKLGEDFLIPTIGIYDSVNDVPFDTLPENFVIKCTHDSGSTFICKKNSGFHTEHIKRELSSKLKKDFYWFGREWSYKGIRPRIIVEEFIPDKDGNSPVDYKFFCFNGKMEVFKIDYNRFTKRAANYYDKNCKYLNFGKIKSIPDPSIKLELPENFEEMVEITEKLSEGIPFLRVDLYSVNNHIYFGELTFYPSSGIEHFTNDGDIFMGKLLDINNI